MIKTTQVIMDELHHYASPKAKVTRLIRAGSLIQVRRGLYVEGKLESNLALSSWIYGPSYISFQYALAFHGLIPERVSVYTCASYNKNKDKIYHTPYGVYQYLYLPNRVYPYGIARSNENDQPYLMATPEKALCDSVYKVSGISDIDDIESLLCDDWRMEKEDILSLDIEFIQQIAPLYRKKSLNALIKWLSKEVHHD